MPFLFVGLPDVNTLQYNALMFCFDKISVIMIMLNQPSPLFNICF